jgi:bacterioferritin (cytochrome b1)
MPKPELGPHVLQALNSILRVQMMAVKQHFIHVLILEAWGDAETAAGITAIDSIDLPNAMRIVDFIASEHAVPELSGDRQSLVRNMPVAGATYEGIFAAARAAERRLIDVLKTSQRTLSTLEAHDKAHLVREPLAARESYQQWMARQAAKGLASGSSSLRLSQSELLTLNALFAHLMVVIEQGIVHSFVHLHSGQEEFARMAWEISGAAMMQAADITKLLAQSHAAPPVGEAVLAGMVALPRVGSTSADAMMLDQALAQRCRTMAESATKALRSTGFESVCEGCVVYNQAVVDWQEGHDLPDITNPCRDFDRTLKMYVFRDGDNVQASA